MMINTPCLTPKCTRTQAPAIKTGQCMVCYSKAKKLVDNGTTTWDALATMGLVNRDLANVNDPFTEAFNAKSKQ